MTPDGAHACYYSAMPDAGVSQTKTADVAKARPEPHVASEIDQPFEVEGVVEAGTAARTLDTIPRRLHPANPSPGKSRSASYSDFSGPLATA